MKRFLLTGGLGNQLFQLAAGLYFVIEDEELHMEAECGAPRRNINGEPELTSFELPKNVLVIDETTRGYLEKKSINLAIRVSARALEEKFSPLVLEVGSSAHALLRMRRKFQIRLNRGVGYDKNFKPVNTGLNIGYYQHYHYTQNHRVIAQMKKLKVKSPGENFLDLLRICEDLRPIGIHIRLGDYLNEDSFGILGSKYYFDAIELLNKLQGKRPIWLYSDNPEKAINFIHSKHRDQINMVVPINLESAETLELLRNSSSLVIGNSTFSWWGAMLIKDNTSTVIAPGTWFKNASTPLNIHNPDWIQLPSSFLETNKIN